MQIYDIDFYPLTLEQGNLRVECEWLGEGWEGDYDMDDTDDTPLLRFSVSKHTLRDDEGNLIDAWEQLDDASYCTRMPVHTSSRILAVAAAVVLEEARRALDGGGSVKKPMERLSWFCPEDFENKDIL